jgi:hypothetical protein
LGGLFSVLFLPRCYGSPAGPCTCRGTIGERRGTELGTIHEGTLLFVSWEDRGRVGVGKKKLKSLLARVRKRGGNSFSNSPACESTSSVTGMCDAKNSAATIEPGRLERGSGAGGIASKAIGGASNRVSRRGRDKIELVFFRSGSLAQMAGKIEHVAVASRFAVLFFTFPLFFFFVFFFFFFRAPLRFFLPLSNASKSVVA